MSSRVGTRRTGWSTLAGVVIVAVLLFPLYWMINAALQRNASASNVDWFPIHATLEGFSKAVSTQDGNLVTSLVVALGAVIVGLLVAVPASYALAQFRLRGTVIVVVALLITQMIPTIVLANSLYSLYINLRLLNSYLGLILADAAHGIPFAILLIRAFMANVPRPLVEAAGLDGAGRLRVLWSIVIPLSRNAIVTAGLFTFLFAWSDFTFALTLTTNGRITPVTLGIYRYLGVYSQDWNALMSIAILASVPAALLLVAAQRYIEGGVSAGSVR